MDKVNDQKAKSNHDGKTGNPALKTLPADLQKDLEKAKDGVFVRSWIVKGLRGDAATALVLSQCLFYATRSQTNSFFLTREGLFHQTGLSRRAYTRCRPLSSNRAKFYGSALYAMLGNLELGRNFFVSSLLGRE